MCAASAQTQRKQMPLCRVGRPCKRLLSVWSQAVTNLDASSHIALQPDHAHTLCLAVSSFFTRLTSPSHSYILTSPEAPGPPCPATAKRVLRPPAAGEPRASGSASTMRRGSPIVGCC